MINEKKLTQKIVPVIISIAIKFKDFDLDNILIDEKSYGNFLVYIIPYKILIGAQPMRIRFDKVIRFDCVLGLIWILLEFTLELDIQHFWS